MWGAASVSGGGGVLQQVQIGSVQMVAPWRLHSWAQGLHGQYAGQQQALPKAAHSPRYYCSNHDRLVSL
jgi:hypothetical protein